MIKVSETAADKLKEVIAKEKNSESIMVRVAFGGYGWGGPKLQLTLDELKNEKDIVVESEGITVVYNSEIEGYVQNSVIDYQDSWFGRGFVIRGSELSSC